MNLEVPKPPDDEKKENKKYKRVPVYTKKTQPKKQVSNTQKEPNKNIGNPVLPIFLIILTICGVISYISNQKTPEEQQIAKMQEMKNEEQRKLQEIQNEEQRKIVEVNDWYMNTSQFSCEDKLKEQLRDPNSYERDKDFTFPTDNGNEKTITWEFRSKNGFGGLTNGIAMCSVSKENGGTIKATILGQ